MLSELKELAEVVKLSKDILELIFVLGRLAVQDCCVKYNVNMKDCFCFWGVGDFRLAIPCYANSDSEFRLYYPPSIIFIYHNHLSSSLKGRQPSFTSQKSVGLLGIIRVKERCN